MLNLKIETEKIMPWMPWMLLLFILLNAFKFTWLSFWLVEGKSPGYIAKFILELGAVGLIYLLIF